jgi:hypothetical protein
VPIVPLADPSKQTKGMRAPPTPPPLRSLSSQWENLGSETNRPRDTQHLQRHMPVRPADGEAQRARYRNYTDGLLRATQWKAIIRMFGGVTMFHPSEDELELFVLGRDPRRELGGAGTITPDRSAIAEHLVRCPACHLKARELRQFALQIRRALEVTASEQAAGNARRASARFWGMLRMLYALPSPRVVTSAAAAAFCVLLVNAPQPAVAPPFGQDTSSAVISEAGTVSVSSSLSPSPRPAPTRYEAPTRRATSPARVRQRRAAARTTTTFIPPSRPQVIRIPAYFSPTVPASTGVMHSPVAVPDFAKLPTSAVAPPATTRKKHPVMRLLSAITRPFRPVSQGDKSGHKRPISREI